MQKGTRSCKRPNVSSKGIGLLKVPLSYCKVSAKFVCAGFERGPALMAWNKPCLVCGSGVTHPPPRPATHPPPCLRGSCDDGWDSCLFGMAQEGHSPRKIQETAAPSRVIHQTHPVENMEREKGLNCVFLIGCFLRSPIFLGKLLFFYPFFREDLFPEHEKIGPFSEYLSV